MKNRILIPIAVSTMTYLIISFTKWNILWFYELPSYDQITRCFSIIMWLLINITIQLSIPSNKKNGK